LNIPVKNRGGNIPLKNLTHIRMEAECTLHIINGLFGLLLVLKHSFRFLCLIHRPQLLSIGDMKASYIPSCMYKVPFYVDKLYITQYP